MDLLNKISDLDLSGWGSVASIIGLLIAIFIGTKVYNIIKVGKIESDNSVEKQENKSWFSIFNIQINKKDR